MTTTHTPDTRTPAGATTTNTRTPLWRAACDACPWSQDAPTYGAAGEAARAHSDDCPDASTTVQPIPDHADALPELTAESSVAEVRWVASEARAVLTDPDPERRARFLARKRALLDYIERTTGGEAS